MKVNISQLLILLAILTNSCAIPQSSTYRHFYQHLWKASRPCDQFIESDYFVVILVDARHLDYTDNRSFLKTVSKHPSDCSKNRDIGHAWIYLQGKVNGERVYLEGGQSGERGLLQARYFDGIMNYIDYGYSREAYAECEISYEPNPIKYLWETLHDGFYQCGAGGHCPTYAAKIDLSKDQFFHILAYVQNHCFSEYALIGNQCSSFVTQVAALGGVDLECETTVKLDQCLWFEGRCLRFWTDPCYSVLTVATPDVVERSLMHAVAEGKAQYALDWYNSR